MIKDKILEYNRYPTITPAFDCLLDRAVNQGCYVQDIAAHRDFIVADLKAYRKKHKLVYSVIGISGGIDSALTASLFHAAGWRVVGVTLPILQNHDETERGFETCRKLGIEHRNIPLDQHYRGLVNSMGIYDPFLTTPSRNHDLVRLGNIRARIRMIVLYNLASYLGGIVASTDNFSELAAGFWTLHGDVGDVGPIQSLNKSWEVPAMAELMGVPESVIKAVPTDGLGISSSDEAQIGCSYLEFDIATFAFMHGWYTDYTDDQTREVLDLVKSRIVSTAYKRHNPYNVCHPDVMSRVTALNKI